MADLKISQLPNAGTLQDSDLIPVVQSSGNELVTTKTTIKSIRAGYSSSLLFYSGGKKAIEALATNLYTYDSNGKKISDLSTTKFAFAHSQVDINMHAEKTNQYECDLIYKDTGLRYTRIEKKNGNVIRASQIRLNSADAYLNAKDSVKISAGTVGNEPNETNLENLQSGVLKLLSGGKILLSSAGAIDVESAKNVSIKTPESALIEAKRFDAKTTTQINIKSPKITFETDVFAVKNSSGALIYNTATIQSLINTIATLSNQIAALTARVTALENK